MHHNEKGDTLIRVFFSNMAGTHFKEPPKSFSTLCRSFLGDNVFWEIFKIVPRCPGKVVMCCEGVIRAELN